MKKTLMVFLSTMVLTLYACTPAANTGRVSPPSSQPGASTPAPVNQSTDWKDYSNDAFGLGFQYPSDWFGPGETISDETLRVEVGSDKVYPYGERPEGASDVKNSYNVVIQYTKNNQNSFWKDTYQALLTLKDGKSLSGARSLLIRVRQLDTGRFKGFEYITTLSETAQTDHVYGREVILVDEQTNDLITILGQPYNVEVGSGTDWRTVYQTIDEANQIFFDKIVESITTR